MTATAPFFALNHMSAPSHTISDFFDLAVSLGMKGVEIRNDLQDNAILDGTPAAALRREAEARDLRILSINALQRFNEWNDTREEEAQIADCLCARLWCRGAGARAGQ